MGLVPDNSKIEWAENNMLLSHWISYSIKERNGLNVDTCQVESSEFENLDLEKTWKMIHTLEMIHKWRNRIREVKSLRRIESAS